MIWLTWRQFRAQVGMMAAALAVLAVILAATGQSLADDYSSGIAACTERGGGCSAFAQGFFDDHRGAFLATTAVVMVLPGLIGLFWGAPLIARELEAGTHRLVWNQSVTRTRWLAVKLGLLGLAAVAAAGLSTFAIDWWSDPIDKAAADEFTRMEPLLFGTRGIVPIAYAVFAFTLAVTVGMLVRRTLAAMAITLVVFGALQVAFPHLRAHLIPPRSATLDVTAANVTGFVFGPDGLELSAEPPDTRAWVLSNHTVDASGRTVHLIPTSSSLSPNSRACSPQAGPPPAADGPGEDVALCLAVVKRLGYRQELTYQPAGRFWPLQWYETAIYAALAAGLSGFCFWWLRHRLT